MTYLNAAYAVHVTTGGKVQLVSYFMELHAITQAANSYALLTIYVQEHKWGMQITLMPSSMGSLFANPLL